MSIKRKFLILISLVIIIFFGKNIYGYNLNWSYTEAMTSDGTQVLRIQMSAGASENTITTWNDNIKKAGYINAKICSEENREECNDWHVFTTEEKRDMSVCGGTTNYVGYKMNFHKYEELTTKYLTSPPTRGDYVKIHYLTDNGNSQTAYISIDPDENKVEYPDPNDPNNIISKTIPTFSDYDTNLVSYAYRVDTGTGTSHFIRQFSKNQLQRVITDLGLKKTITNTVRLSTQSCTTGGRPELNNNNAMDATYKYYANIKGLWSTRTYGYNIYDARDDGVEGWNFVQDDKYIDAENCTANEYDNLVTFEPLDEEETEVYVRHKDTAGNTIAVSSSTQTLSNGTTLSNLGQSGKYTEKYKISRNQTLTVRYVGKYISANGKVYQFKSSSYGDSTVSLNSAESSVSSIGTEYPLSASDEGKRKYIVIEYTYEEITDITKEFPDPDPDPDEPNGDPSNPGGSGNQGNEIKAGTFTTLSLIGKINDGRGDKTINPVPNGVICNTQDAREDSSVLYVPSSEKVNIKINSQKFMYKRLVQSPYVDSYGNLRWKLTAEMYVLNPNVAYAKNSSNSGTTFFGSSNTSVVNRGSPYGFGAKTTTNLGTIVNEVRTHIGRTFGDYLISSGAAPSKSVLNVLQVSKQTVGSVDFESGWLDVLSTAYNGKRVVSGHSNYSLYTFQFDGSVSNGTKKSDVNINTNSTSINIYTPLNVSNVKIETDKSTVINHSDNTDVTQLQKGSTFTIDPAKNQSFNYNGVTINTSKYAKGYQLVFDFGVNDKPAGTVFNIGPNEKFTGTVTGDINQTNNSFKIMGITRNEPTINGYTSVVSSKFQEEMSTTDTTTISSNEGQSTTKVTTTTVKYAYKQYIDRGTIGKITVEQNACNTNYYLNFTPGVDLKEGSYYRVVYRAETTNVGRIYGFRVTDCSDINWKGVFRNSDSSQKVNSVTGTVYFSGKKVYDYVTNSMINAVDSNKNNNIIMLAPYKHSDSTYIFAPKLGYRISFDLKTSGYYDYRNSAANAQRKIQITPSYYFIKKDGTGYTDDINLYYKNSSGNYVLLSNSNYNISFIPKDGYRHTFDNANTLYEFNTDIMSDKLLTITVSKTFELISGNGSDSRGMMAIDESSNFGSVQVWFGEYKLPNSTIVVKKGESINSPLTDGYIGVKFDIKCIDTMNGGKKVTLSYNQNNKNSNSLNTTQWDYDEYLGYTGRGQEFNGNIPIQLEKGTWYINSQAEWNKVKGTVVLYDADNRAADDFQ